MSNPKTTTNQNPPARTYTVEESLEYIRKTFSLLSKDELLDDLRERAMPAYKSATGADREVLAKEMCEVMLQVLSASGIEHHYPLVESVEEKYQPLVRQITSDMIQEYFCTTTGEKALVELIASSYVRYLACSTAYKAFLCAKTITDEQTRHYASLSKEVDRAHRQFVSGITALKQLRTPALELTIKADTAFLAQNQQINSCKAEEKPQ